jgi:5-methylcytosine-specific restriction endonuclease McrA
MDNEQSYWQILEQEFSCDHSTVQFAKFTQSNGVVIVREQCLRCGKSIKNVPKSKFDLSKLPVFNERIAAVWNTRKNLRREQLWQEQEQRRLAQKQEQNAEWWAKYNKYLMSTHWADLRKRVLERDGGICQACLRNKATQAHHLSYDLYNELGFSAAFELVAICYQCHNKIHPHMARAQYQLSNSLYNAYLQGATNVR